MADIPTVVLGAAGGGGLPDTGANGLVARIDAAPTTAARTITSSSGELTVTNGNGVAGNPDLVVSAIAEAKVTGLVADLAAKAANTDFVASGVGHAHGLVPDPGGAAGATKFLREDATWQVPAGAGALTLTEVEANLGASPTLSGHFDITGLAGLTPNKQVLVQQKAAAYTGKGALFDEMEFDQVSAGGYVVDAATIRVYWKATGPVQGNIKFGWQVSG